MSTPEELAETSPIEVIKPDLYERLLGGQAMENIILSSD